MLLWPISPPLIQHLRDELEHRPPARTERRQPFSRCCSQFPKSYEAVSGGWRLQEQQIDARASGTRCSIIPSHMRLAMRCIWNPPQHLQQASLLQRQLSVMDYARSRSLICSPLAALWPTAVWMTVKSCWTTPTAAASRNPDALQRISALSSGIQPASPVKKHGWKSHPKYHKHEILTCKQRWHRCLRF